ncbi:hypothetical protein KCU65_g5776, partial [Aureobasidium melanogenum]
MSPEEDPYQCDYNQYEDSIESLNGYKPGGFPIIQIGELLHENRYKIVDKLGRGGSSTIWLASCTQSNELVAIKALKATASSDEEARFLSRFAERRDIRQLIESFKESGPNGEHTFLVLEPALCSVRDAKKWSYFRPLPLSIARRLIADLVATVQDLYAQGVVHGDIHTGNILLRLPEEIRTMDADSLYERIGRPETGTVTRKDGKPLSRHAPSEIVLPAPLPIKTKDISPSLHLPAMLSDFGEAFEPPKTRRDFARTLLTSIPPESFSSKEGSGCISFPPEIWTLACTFIEMIGNGSPFDFGHVIANQVLVLGKLPEPWWSQWNPRSKYFDTDVTTYLPGNCKIEEMSGTKEMRGTGSLEKDYDRCVTGPRSRCKEKIFGPEERRAFLDMLASMLIYDPSKRATIDQIAECEWIQRWARVDRN